jgi:hypothetical protein
MDTIYIGEKVKVNEYCTASNMFLKGDEKNDISENSEEYWVHGCIFNSHVRIRKSSRLGNDITTAIAFFKATGGDVSEIYKLIDMEILRNHITIEDIYIEIENLKTEFIQKGKEEKQAEIRYVLGIY